MNQHMPAPYTDFIAILVRIIGVVVLIVGLVVGIKVIMEAWNLYEKPENIERFAKAIEQGSNLDQLLKSVTDDKTSAKAPVQVDGENMPTEQPQANEPLRLTYFIAWGLVIVLLMVIGGLASSAIRTGGQLALYDLQVKRLARQMIKEARQAQSE
jgi:hypothetical protein